MLTGHHQIRQNQRKKILLNPCAFDRPATTHLNGFLSIPLTLLTNEPTLPRFFFSGVGLALGVGVTEGFGDGVAVGVAVGEGVGAVTTVAGSGARILSAM